MIRREKQSIQRRRRNAFTLMEMLVVVAIIVALAGMGGFYFMGQLNESKKSTAKVQVKVLNDAKDTYEIWHNKKLTDPSQLLEASDGKEKILKNEDALKDPWGKPYLFQNNEFSCVLEDGKVIK